MNLIYLFSISLLTELTSILFETPPDFSWEVVDGLQRLTTLILFIGDDDALELLGSKGKNHVVYEHLRLQGLEKLTEFNGYCFDELPSTIRTMFKHRPIKVTVLNDKLTKITNHAKKFF